MNLSHYGLFFLLILISSQTAFAMTDQQLSDKYRGDTPQRTLANIQDAINNKTLNCSDLPSDIIAFNCPDTQAKLDAAKGKEPTAPLPDNGSYFAGTHIIDTNSPAYKQSIVGHPIVIGGAIAAGFAGLSVMALVLVRGGRMTNVGFIFWAVGLSAIAIILWSSIDDNVKVGVCIITGGISIALGNAFVVRGRQSDRILRERYQRSHEDNQRDYGPYGKDSDDGENRTDDGSLLPKKGFGSSVKPRKSKHAQISTFHKILLTLGIIKVTKK